MEAKLHEAIALSSGRLDNRSGDETWWMRCSFWPSSAISRMRLGA